MNKPTRTDNPQPISQELRDAQAAFAAHVQRQREARRASALESKGPPLPPLLRVDTLDELLRRAREIQSTADGQLQAAVKRESAAQREVSALRARHSATEALVHAYMRLRELEPAPGVDTTTQGGDPQPPGINSAGK